VCSVEHTISAHFFVQSNHSRCLVFSSALLPALQKRPFLNPANLLDAIL
jgi:hypothetical protein